MGARVVAVVVTWNRRQLLRECLAAVTGQTHEPHQVVVVDNASTDDTAHLLSQEYADLRVLSLPANTGGAGGFAVGIDEAMRLEPDLLWLLDDDTVPTPDALEQLVRAWSSYDGQPALVASRVTWTDGRDHPMNTPRVKPAASSAELRAAAAVGCDPIRSASFVSVLCDAAVVRARGLPVADYFLWNDDFEYSTRLIRGGVGLYCRASVVVHKTSTFASTDADPGERFFFEVRNKIWMLARSRGLSPPEKLLYGGSTLRRWGRTFARSSDRGTLARALVRGTSAGLRRGPRRNDEVLGGLLPPTPPPGPPAEFSLLISTFAGDDPAYLRLAFTSTVHDQTRRPDEVVVVQDGPVPDALASTIADLTASSPVPVTHVVLPENQGLGPALDAGLRSCSHEVVARMDADDVSLPTRFERQLPLVEAGADIVGAGLLEFEDSPTDVVGRRTPPTDPQRIRDVISFRDPFNHPTVVYRRSAVLSAGGYQDLSLMEDYLLFARMVSNGARPANVADPLVLYRVGAGAYARRGGRQLLRSELALQRRFRELGITTRGEYVRNVTVRGGYRLVPVALRRAAYRRLLANRGR